MDLDAYLRHHRLSLEAVEKQLEEALGLDESDIVLLAGSLIEGLGNPTSDLDIYLLSQRNRADLTPVHTKVISIGDTVVDVDVYSFAQIEELLSRFNEWATTSTSPLDAFTFSWKDRELLHSFRVAHVLRNPKAGESIRARIGRADLARHKLDHARHHVGTHQVDLAGLYAEQDWYTMFYVAQELLGHAVDALLAGHLHTNPKRKWRMRLLAKVPDDWEANLPGRASGQTALEYCLALLCAPRDMTPVPIYRHSLAIAAFARAATVWAQWQLLAAAEEDQRMPAAVANLPAAVETEPRLPALDLDIGFDYLDKRFAIYRLNRDEPAIEVSATALAVISLFDGWSTESQAAQLLTGVSPQRATEEVQNLQALVRIGKFQAPALADSLRLAELLGEPER